MLDKLNFRSSAVAHSDCKEQSGQNHPGSLEVQNGLKIVQLEQKYFIHLSHLIFMTTIHERRDTRKKYKKQR